MTYILKIVRDESPSNPWEDWDTQPPLFYEYGRNSKKSFFQRENPLEELLEEVTDRKLALHFKELCNVMEIEDMYYEQHKYTKGEWLRNEIEQLDPTTKRIEALAKVANIYCHKWTSRGYSQGDWADCIVVLTPEYCKRIGTEPKHYKDICTSAQKLFDAYMWGDVYGFQPNTSRSWQKPANIFLNSLLCLSSKKSKTSPRKR